MLVIPSASSGVCRPDRRQRGLVGQAVAALGLAGALGMQRQIGFCRASATSKRSATFPFEQFKFDFADGLLTLAGDDLAAVEGDLDARSLLRRQQPEAAREVGGEHRRQRRGRRFEKAAKLLVVHV
jgi:hypothetical protein